MGYRQFLLDTHILVWYLTNSDRLDKGVRHDITFSQNKYYVNVLSLLEIKQLQQLNKIELNYSLKKILKHLIEASIEILYLSELDLFALENLPIYSFELYKDKDKGSSNKKEKAKVKVKKVQKDTDEGSKLKKHADYIDRALISMCISRNITIISADQRFPTYRAEGLQLLEVED